MNEITQIINNIDIGQLLIIAYYVTEFSFKKNNEVDEHRYFRLSRRQLSNIDEVIFSPEFINNNSTIDYNELAKKKFGKEIINFTKIMLENFPSEKLNNFYNNINNLTVEDKTKKYKNKFFKNVAMYFSFNPTANYSPVDNRIRVFDDDFKMKSIPHELFHMASSYYDKVTDSVCCGFSQSNDLKIFGYGLNEGYTEYMVEKYYGGDYNTDSYSYNYVRKVVKELELIIGKEKMEEFYLNSDLNGLIEELSKYMTHEQIIDFINITDYIGKGLDSSIIKKDMIDSKLYSISNFIIELGVKKSIKLYKNKEIYSNMFLYEINRLLNINLDFQYYYNRTFKSISKSEAYDLVMLILNENNIDLQGLDNNQEKYKQK